MSTNEDDDERIDDGICSQMHYNCLGDALDAMDKGLTVDPVHLRDLARKSIGPFESELVFETEDGQPISIDVPCDKNPGHTSFVPVSKFKPEDIPERHRTKRFYDMILAWANLAVRVVVKRVSRNRPEVYSDTMTAFPNSEKNLLGSTRKIRVGSGYVVSGFGINQPYTGQFCPCHLCRDSGERREFWSLNIATVTHVIYDSSEARDSVFQFFYDSEDKKSTAFMYGTDSFEQLGKNTEKICIVRCVTHDGDLVRQLRKAVTFCHSMNTSKEELKLENDPAVLISHPHGKCKCISMGNVINFTVPSGTDFPVNQPIAFTRTSECRLPLLPWSENSRLNDLDKSQFGQLDAVDGGDGESKNTMPLPSPIAYPDTEMHLEAIGFFVINTGKNQMVLSPKMFKRESDHLASLSHVESQDGSGQTVQCEVREGAATVSNSGDHRKIANDLEYFYDSSDFRCINVDENSVFTLDDVYFGNPTPPRNMRLDGLTKPPDAPKLHIPAKLDVQSAKSVIERMAEGSRSSLTIAESNTNKQQNIIGNIPDTINAMEPDTQHKTLVNAPDTDTMNAMEPDKTSEIIDKEGAARSFCNATGSDDTNSVTDNRAYNFIEATLDIENTDNGQSKGERKENEKNDKKYNSSSCYSIRQGAEWNEEKHSGKDHTPGENVLFGKPVCETTGSYSTGTGVLDKDKSLQANSQVVVHSNNNDGRSLTRQSENLTLEVQSTQPKDNTNACGDGSQSEDLESKVKESKRMASDSKPDKDENELTRQREGLEVEIQSAHSNDNKQTCKDGGQSENPASKVKETEETDSKPDREENELAQSENRVLSVKSKQLNYDAGTHGESSQSEDPVSKVKDAEGTDSLPDKDESDFKQNENRESEVQSAQTIDSCTEAGALEDLSIPELLQMLVDKGINPFPENEDENISDLDLVGELISSLYLGGCSPLLSTLNKIHEEVSTRNIKPLTLKPGSRFNLPEGMTFTLPEKSRFALRFHDISTSWFTFPSGTMFHTSEGKRVDFPSDSEFSFSRNSVVQGFMTYTVPSCPGSSGGLVLLGKGKWQSGNFSHSGQFDNLNHVNRSSLRRWHLYTT